MIESIYIIDLDSGVPLIALELNGTQNTETFDPDIFSGFLKVFNDLSQETRNENINQVILDSSRLIYQIISVSNKKLLFVTVDDLDQKSLKIRKCIKKIAVEFEKSYAGEINIYGGNISLFNPFKEKIRSIIIANFGTPKQKKSLKRKKNPMELFLIKHQAKIQLYSFKGPIFKVER